MRPLAPARRAATAARIAWRDLRKDPRQGVLVALLVALPAVVLMTVSIVTAGQQPTDAQRITEQLGSNEAWVTVVGEPGAPVTQWSEDPTQMSVGDVSTRGAEPIGGFAATEDTLERDVATLLPDGVRSLVLTPAHAYLASDAADAAGGFEAVVGPAWDPAFAGMYDVVDGSAPGEDQVMVSTELASRWGLEVGDELTLGRDGAQRTVAGVVEMPLLFDDGTVFGTADALAPGLGDGATAAASVTYLPDLALDWDAVQALNADGVAAYSRTVAEDPPQAYLDASAAAFPPMDAVVDTGVILGAGLGLLEVVLLAGAAFAVSMRRRQERLALLAATGAGRGTLVGVGVWNGALLGLAGGVIGVPVGLAAGAAWLWALATWGDPYTQVWGLHVTWWQVGAVLAFTTVAGALSALVPAIASSRRDVMAALRGSRRPGKAKRWPGVLGATLIGAAVAAFAYAIHLREVAWESTMIESTAPDALAAVFTLVGVVLLLAGLTALTPSALRLAARVLGPLGVGARLAARDAARHAGRTVPVVAAIAVTVILAGNVALDTVRSLELWQTTETFDAPPGDAAVSLMTWSVSDAGEQVEYGDPAAIVAAAEDAMPGVEHVELDQVPDAFTDAMEGHVAVVSVPEESRCPAWTEAGSEDWTTTTTKRAFYEDVRCLDNRASEQAFGIAVGGGEELGYLLGREPTSTELEVLDGGGAVTFHPYLIGPDAEDGDGGSVSLETWAVGGGKHVGGGEPASVTELPAIAAQRGYEDYRFVAFISPETAASLGADVVPGYVFLHQDGGFTELEGDQLSAAVMRVGEYAVRVATPQDWGANVLLWGTLGATLLVAGAAAGLALGLARADARRDDLTLASLGASPRLARSVAAWQGGILVGFAVWTGMACAVALDVIRAMERTSSGPLPWAVLPVALLVPPLVVAGLAWVMTRAPKAVHYRLAA